MENLKLSMLCKAGVPATIILWGLAALCYKKFGLDSLYIFLKVLAVILLLPFCWLAVRVAFGAITAALALLKERKN